MCQPIFSVKTLKSNDFFGWGFAGNRVKRFCDMALGFFFHIFYLLGRQNFPDYGFSLIEGLASFCQTLYTEMIGFLRSL